jgi:hypothetical protein
MFLVLSEFTSSPFSLIATTKVSVFNIYESYLLICLFWHRLYHTEGRVKYFNSLMNKEFAMISKVEVMVLLFLLARSTYSS